MCCIFHNCEMPQRVVNLSVVWIYILHVTKLLSHCVTIQFYLCVCLYPCVIFRPLVILAPSCNVQLHVFTTSPLLCLYPHLYKELHEITSDFYTPPSVLLEGHCHSIRHCLEVLLEMGPPRFGGGRHRLNSLICVCLHMLSHMGHFHRTLTHGFDA